MSEPFVPTPDDDARTLGVLGLLIAFVIPLVGVLVCIQSLYRTDGSNGPNRAAIAGFPVAIAVAAGQMALLLWLLSPWR